MKSLKDIVENFTETPSEKCWESIEQQLGNIMPNTPNSGSEAASAAGQSGTASGLGKVGTIASKASFFSGKMIAIFSAAAITTAVAVISIVSLNKVENRSFPSQPITQQNEQIPVDSGTTATIEEVTPEKITTEEKELYPIEKREQEPVTLGTLTTPDSEKNGQQSQNHSIMQVQTTATPAASPVPSPVKPTTPAISSPVATPTQTPQQTNIDISDPVLENMELPEPDVVKIEVPNIFTPNNDGYNDTFAIGGIENCEENRLTIRNGYGKIVFDVMNYQNDWTGDAQPEGVYTYTFVYKIHNISDRISGKVMLRR